MPRSTSSRVLLALLGLAPLLLAACGGGGGGGTVVTPPPPTPSFTWTTFQEATLVIGQADATSRESNRGGSVDADTLSFPCAPCFVGGRVFVPDLGNNRVVGFDTIPTTGGAADFVVGQPDLMSDAANRGGSAMANTLNQPWAVCGSGGKLFISDTANNRVLVFNAVPTADGAAADVAVGQAGLMSGTGGGGQAGLNTPVGIHAVGSKLIVCDLNNNRVMIWNTIPTSSGTNADLVLGQADFASVTANRGAMSPDANTLASPFGVWSDGTKLAVADGGNNRVLVWNSFPTTNGQAADLVLGQASFTTNAPATSATGMRVPTDVTSVDSILIVGDCENNRILIFDTFPTSSGAAATTVLGQGVFTLGAPNDDDQNGFEDGACTARTMRTPGGYATVTVFGKRIFSGDFRNHRALVYVAP